MFSGDRQTQPPKPKLNSTQLSRNTINTNKTCLKQPAPNQLKRWKTSSSKQLNETEARKKPRQLVSKQSPTPNLPNPQASRAASTSAASLTPNETFECSNRLLTLPGIGGLAVALLLEGRCWVPQAVVMHADGAVVHVLSNGASALMIWFSRSPLKLKHKDRVAKLTQTQALRSQVNPNWNSRLFVRSRSTQT